MSTKGGLGYVPPIREQHGFLLVPFLSLSSLLPSPFSPLSSPSQVFPFFPTPLLLLTLIFHFNTDLLSILYRPGAALPRLGMQHPTLVGGEGLGGFRKVHQLLGLP